MIAGEQVWSTAEIDHTFHCHNFTVTLCVCVRAGRETIHSLRQDLGGSTPDHLFVSWDLLLPRYQFT
jgi:hypothetical protein